MALHRYKLTPSGPLGTPFQSDTIYGHLLCAAAEIDGDDATERLIQDFEKGSPPFKISSALPEGMFPMPVLPEIPRRRFRQISDADFGGDMFAALETYKQFKDIKHIPLQGFLALKGNLSCERLFRHYIQQRQDYADPPHFVAIRPHASIDRQSGVVLSEGGFYLSEETHFEHGAGFQLYVETNDLSIIEKYLKYLSQTGFGKKRSSGNGQFTLEKDDTFDASIFTDSGTQRMTLSVCAAENMSDFAGHYSLFTKFGKVGDGFGHRNPFKKPFIAFREGSVFTDMPNVGYVLHNIHADPKIVQILWPLTVALHLEVPE